MAVVVRRPDQQLQEIGIESGSRVDGFEGRAQLVGRHFGLFATFDDHTDDAPTTERHPHALPGREVGGAGAR